MTQGTTIGYQSTVIDPTGDIHYTINYAPEDKELCEKDEKELVSMFLGPVESPCPVGEGWQVSSGELEVNNVRVMEHIRQVYHTYVDQNNQTKSEGN